MKRLLFVLICLVIVSISHAEIVYFEAEDSSVYYVEGTNWETMDNAAAQGGKCITPIVGHGGSAIEEEIRNYSFEIEAGTYENPERLEIALRRLMEDLY